MGGLRGRRDGGGEERCGIGLLRLGSFEGGEEGGVRNEEDFLLCSFCFLFYFVTKSISFFFLS